MVVLAHPVLAVQTDVLVRSLAIAVVLVSPYGWLKWRQVRAVRAERIAREQAAAAAASPEPTRPTLEDVVDAISALAPDDDPGAAPATVLVPHDVTVGGSEPPPGLVDTLVRDALRRSGWVPTSELDTPAGRMIEVRRRTGPA